MKKNRLAKIVELINTYDIETQEELAEKLRASGYDVTQATVSRDIRELKLSKVPSADGRQKYSVLAQTSSEGMSDKYVRVIKECLVSCEAAQNILVIKTVTGMANAVAVAIDDMNMKEIVGTVAGDDTMLLVMRDNDDTVYVRDEILSLLDK